MTNELREAVARYRDYESSVIRAALNENARSPPQYPGLYADREALATYAATLLAGMPAPVNPNSKVVTWQKPEPDMFFGDGDQMLVAVPVNCRHGGKPYWEYSVVVVSCDEDHFDVNTHDGDWGWSWSDVEWFMDLPRLNLPVVELANLLAGMPEGLKGGLPPGPMVDEMLAVQDGTIIKPGM